ncbi:hypothetical protein M885DRAFT_589972 [Pelagophyceae sp. CCMP2097]|nr:hypothetical protein M885DRAFT_589972 [Pelagophyceae sp. CCMP2097]
MSGRPRRSRKVGVSGIDADGDAVLREVQARAAAAREPRRPPKGPQPQGQSALAALLLQEEAQLSVEQHQLLSDQRQRRLDAAAGRLFPLEAEARAALPEIGAGDRPRLHLAARESAGVVFDWRGEPARGCLVVAGYVDAATAKRAALAGAALGRALLSVNGVSLSAMPRATVMSRMQQAAELPRQLGFGEYTDGVVAARRQRPRDPLGDADAPPPLRSASQPQFAAAEGASLGGRASAPRRDCGAAVPWQGGAHSDPFSTPTRRRRINIEFAKKRVAEYVRAALALAGEHRLKTLAVIEMQKHARRLLAKWSVRRLRMRRADRAAGKIARASLKHSVRCRARRRVSTPLQTLARSFAAKRRVTELKALKLRRAALELKIAMRAAQAMQRRFRGVTARNDVYTLRRRIRAVTKFIGALLLSKEKRAVLRWHLRTREAVAVSRLVAGMWRERKAYLVRCVTLQRLAAAGDTLEALRRFWARGRAWRAWLDALEVRRIDRAAAEAAIAAALAQPQEVVDETPDDEASVASSASSAAASVPDEAPAVKLWAPPPRTCDTCGRRTADWPDLEFAVTEDTCTPCVGAAAARRAKAAALFRLQTEMRLLLQCAVRAAFARREAKRRDDARCAAEAVRRAATMLQASRRCIRAAGRYRHFVRACTSLQQLGRRKIAAERVFRLSAERTRRIRGWADAAWDSLDLDDEVELPPAFGGSDDGRFDKGLADAGDTPAAADDAPADPGGGLDAARLWLEIICAATPPPPGCLVDRGEMLRSLAAALSRHPIVFPEPHEPR